MPQSQTVQTNLQPMGATTNNESTTTEPPPKNGRQPKPLCAKIYILLAKFSP